MGRTATPTQDEPTAVAWRVRSSAITRGIVIPGSRVGGRKRRAWRFDPGVQQVTLLCSSGVGGQGSVKSTTYVDGPLHVHGVLLLAVEAGAAADSDAG
jgi:hypothetical protein